MNFQELVRYIEQAGVHAHLFGTEKVGGYHIQQNPTEFASFLGFLRERPQIRRYLEIGSASGGFIRCIHELVGFDQAVMIDDGSYQGEMQDANIAGFREKVKRFTCDSHGPVAKLALQDETPFDLIFVDGDHSYEGVMKDVELVLPYAAADTLIAFHDVQCGLVPDVQRAYEELLASGKLVEITRYISVDSDHRFGIGVCRLP